MQEDSLGLAISTLDRLASFLKPPTSSKIKSTIVALYSSQHSPLQNEESSHLRFSGQIALLHLDYDRRYKNYFFRLYQLQRLTLLLQVELYYGFMKYFRAHEENPCLYYFQYLEDGHFAFLFRNCHEAQSFQTKLQQVAPKQQAFNELKRLEKQEEEKAKKANSFFGKVIGFFNKKQSNSKQQSKIVEIRKSSAIMFDNQGTIITQNISPEWKEIIKNSGLRKADLKKRQVVKTILEETLIYEAGRASIKNPSLFSQSQISKLQQLKLQQQQSKSKSLVNFSQSTQPNNQQNDLTKQPLNTQKITVQQQNDKLAKKSQDSQSKLPIPPPINLLFKQSQLQQSSNISNYHEKAQMTRSDLLEQIKTNKVILKPVKTKQGGKIEIDASTLNKEERKDLGEQIRLRLQRRAINMRRKAEEDSDDDSQN